MSITMRTIAAEATARSTRPVEVRFSAVSSALASDVPELMSAFAFSIGLAYSTNERSSAAVAIAQSTIAAITHPSQGWNSTRRIASQSPTMITPTRPTIVAPVATSPTRWRFNVFSGVSAVSPETTTIHDITSEPTSVAANSR
jgi:hypothetical protein